MRNLRWFGVGFLAFLCLLAAGCTPAVMQLETPDLVTEAEEVTEAIGVLTTPTAVVDWQGTAVVAQQTADEARRLNSMATVEYVGLLNDQLAMTAEIERQDFEREAWTATAALTSIPLTRTQQAVLNTQIPRQQALLSAQLTATEAAPTHLVAMIEAQNYERYGSLDYIVRLFAFAGIGIFSIGIVVFLLRIPIHVPEEAPARGETKASDLSTPVWIKKDTGGGGFSIKRYDVPCTADQLSELAELAVNGERTFAINRIENTSRTLRRDTLYAIREFLLLNEFAIEAGAGKIALHDTGVNFLEYWFENHTLQMGFQFGGAVAMAGVV